MADAIAPVPIYDPQYQQIANLVINAKAIYQINIDVPQASGYNTTPNIEIPLIPFNILIITNLSASYSSFGYMQAVPLSIITSNLTQFQYIPFYTDSGNNSYIRMYLKVTSSDSSIYMSHSYETNNGKIRTTFTVAIID